MMSLLNPGPDSLGKDFDVFMEPLIEELLQLYAAIIWSIHDFSAQHTLSGRITTGYQAYAHCDKDPCSKRMRRQNILVEPCLHVKVTSVCTNTRGIN